MDVHIIMENSKMLPMYPQHLDNIYFPLRRSGYNYINNVSCRQYLRCYNIGDMLTPPTLGRNYTDSSYETNRQTYLYNYTTPKL